MKMREGLREEHNAARKAFEELNKELLTFESEERAKRGDKVYLVTVEGSSRGSCLRPRLGNGAKLLEPRFQEALLRTWTRWKLRLEHLLRIRLKSTLIMKKKSS